MHNKHYFLTPINLSLFSILCYRGCGTQYVGSQRWFFLCGFQGLNSGSQASRTSTFTQRDLPSLQSDS